MNGTGKVQISYREAVSLLTVSSVFSSITFSLHENMPLCPMSYMIAFALGVAFNFLLILPYFLLLKRYGGMSVLDCSYRLFGKFSVVFALAFFLFLCGVGAKCVSEFDAFLLNEVFPDASHFVIITLLVLACAYGAFLGIEALGRFANLVFFFTCFSVLLILISLLGKFDLLNFGITQKEEIGTIFMQSFRYASSNPELVTVLLITPVVNKKLRKGFALWNLLALILVEGIAFSVIGTLGDYAQVQLYPYYRAATVAEISVLKRLDAAHLCVWILVAFTKITYYLLLTKNVLDTLIRKSAKKFSLIVSAMLLFVLSVLTVFGSEFAKNLGELLLSPYVIFSAVVFFPLILWFVSLAKGDRLHEKD